MHLLDDMFQPPGLESCLAIAGVSARVNSDWRHWANSVSGLYWHGSLAFYLEAALLCVQCSLPLPPVCWALWRGIVWRSFWICDKAGQRSHFHVSLLYVAPEQNPHLSLQGLSDAHILETKHVLSFLPHTHAYIPVLYMQSDKSHLTSCNSPSLQTCTQNNCHHTVLSQRGMIFGVSF